MTLRFHLDENVDPAVAEGLRNRGVDATTTAEVRLTQASDEEQLAFVRAQGRVLVTHDADFLRFHSRGAGHSGLVYCSQRGRSVGELVRALSLMSECLTAEDMRNQVEFI